MLRSFALRTVGIDLTAFVRAALAIELGDKRPVDLLLKDAEAPAGPVRRVGPQDEEAQQRMVRSVGPNGSDQGAAVAVSGSGRATHTKESMPRRPEHAWPGWAGSGSACRPRGGSPSDE
ncbi:DUF6420 family protein [Streptomyces sp. TRM70308]|uniref:DUF6420 family protein n=1 Tax=Streptomyces sp. TRM70308 TaxID=3131932 RepID=UPI003D056135